MAILISDETDIQFNENDDLYVAVEVTDDWIVDNADPNSEDGSTWEDEV